MQLAPYLFFDGACEAALAFYAGALGGRVVNISRWGEAPQQEGMPAQAPDRVMHASFEAPGISLMAADGDEEARGEMRRVALSIATADVDEGRRIFERLAEGGRITAPFSEQFWGASFGMLVDRFGVRWMVNAG